MQLAHAVPGQLAPTVVLEIDAVKIDSREEYLLEIGAVILIFAADHGTLRKQNPHKTPIGSLAEAILLFSYTEGLPLFHPVLPCSRFPCRPFSAILAFRRHTTGERTASRNPPNRERRRQAGVGPTPCNQ